LDPASLFSLIASVGTLTGLWLNGHRSLWAPIIGMWNFIPWMAFTYATGAWPLVFMNVVILCLHFRTFILWRNLR
jgi:hypothetical protein